MTDWLKYQHLLSLPCYVYDWAKILARIKLLKDNLPENVLLYYAVKANSNLQLLKALKDKVDGLDISSGGELEQASLAGYAPQTFSFAGPGKTDAEIELAVKSGCGSLSAESLDDLQRIERTAQKLGRTAYVSLRVNPATPVEKFALKMGGKPTQFGIDEEDLASLPQLKNSKLVGLHVYAGTQCLAADALAQNLQNSLALASKIAAPLAQINIGGGFGVDYYPGQEPLDIAAVCTALSQAAQKLPQTKIILELGRYLIAPAGDYLCPVINIKKSRGKTFVIVDGGLHQNISATGNLGQVLKKNYKISNLSRPEGAKCKVELAGCLCTPLDTLAVNLELPEPRQGDTLCVHNSGAYGYTASPLLFLGHPTPPEYLLQDNKITLIRRSRRLVEFN
ncbi:pyridoxal-dependent decarboxylase [Candidatus Termititenax persephonae]|uniref:Pyridoxal-dependent decarboxylase n=1 Tax=Candidatus Termititenax persephonae TaxID=2218525 RepID=A0A388TI78_9BACT|nr:pyridoxal-dependent decarboxylase [Candidatus Termititenax persephonae]